MKAERFLKWAQFLNTRFFPPLLVFQQRPKINVNTWRLRLGGEQFAMRGKKAAVEWHWRMWRRPSANFFPFSSPRHSSPLLLFQHARSHEAGQIIAVAADWLPPQHLWSFLCSEIRSLPCRKKCESPRDSNNPPIQIRASILMKREVIVRAKIIRQRKSLQIPLSLFCSFNLCLRFGILRWRVSGEVRSADSETSGCPPTPSESGRKSPLNPFCHLYGIRVAI